MNRRFLLAALAAVVLMATATAQATAQHPIRPASQQFRHYTGGHRVVGPASADCCDSVSHGAVYSDSCGSCNDCCSPCVRLCLPNPCRLIDRIGTAMHGLRDLFRCCCCCDPILGGCSPCHGVIEEEMPYLNLPHSAPPTPQVDPAPQPAGYRSAARPIGGYRQLQPVTVAAPVKAHAHGTPVSRPVERATRTAPQRSTVQRLSFQEPIESEPIEAQPITPRPIAPRPAPAASKSSSDNPLR